MFCWNNNGLSKDMEELAFLVRQDPRDLADLWESGIKKMFIFIKKRGVYHSPYLLDQKRKQRERSKKMAENAEKGWSQRKKDDELLVEKVGLGKEKMEPRSVAVSRKKMASSSEQKHSQNDASLHPIGNALCLYLDVSSKEKEVKEKETPTPSSKAPTPATAPYGRVVAHILASYEQRFKVPLYFNGAGGKIVKRLLSNYHPARVMALWDVFISRDWHMKDGKKRPHDLQNFEWKIQELLEGGEYKAKEAKYEGEANSDAKKLMENLSGVLKDAGN